MHRAIGAARRPGLPRRTCWHVALRRLSAGAGGGAVAETAAAAQTDSVLIANAPGLRVVDMNRPKALNALNGQMVATLLPLVRDWQTPGGDVKMVIFRGSGPRAFCAGGDIRFLADCAAGGTSTRQGAYDFFREEYSLNYALGTSHVPIVSLLDGIVMGGGVGLSVHGQFRVATESTLFAMPEVGIGFFPDVGGTYFLPRLRGSLGMYLGLTGARLSGRDVVAAGVATHFVSSERLEMLEGVLAQFGGQAAANNTAVDQSVMSSAIAQLDGIDHYLTPG
jgi:3-hydroxyisobutyryl-CoA hydrolase